jgi:tetratricopeptide (TPR) repeat protein
VAISEFEYFLQGEDTEQDISHMLKVLRSAKSWKPLDVTRFVGSGAAAIGTIAGFNRILRFLTINDAIIGDPIENRGIADLVSRFSPNGLGPYFSNVPNLCRNPCDFFLLIELANLPSTDDIDVWLLLLSNPLSTTATIDLAIECGGRGLPRSMELLLTRAIRNQSFYPDSLAQMKRIVNLSHAHDFDEIALEAQTIIVKDRKFDGIELGILGDIYLSLGRYDEARQAYSRYMEVDPTEKRAWKAVAQFTEIEDRRNLKRFFLQVERR